MVVHQLVELAQKLVEKYDEIKIEEPSESDLLKIASDIARTANIEKLTSVNGASSLNPVEQVILSEKGKRFVEVYCATALFVTAQYFINPYSDDDSGVLKRPLSPWSLEDSEEENFEPSLSKKRKFSF